jgi:formate C-acetyltransferase
MEAYDQLFAGDPTWVTESIGGQLLDGRTKVTKSSFRFLNTLYNLGPSPEPNITVLWSIDLPEGFKKYCAKVSIETSSIQYENDDLMRCHRDSDDYGIACCVSFQEALNQGRCENTNVQLVNGIPSVKEGPLNYDDIMINFRHSMKEVARVYNEAMNIIHYMHDKYYYEKAQMALIDTNPRINIAYGIAGLSIVADSLSAIKHARVTPIRNEEGLTVDFKIEGEFPKFGNDDDRVDMIARDVVAEFNAELEKLPVYKEAKPTMSVLTITSNVVYGKKTGATPDGRAKGVPFAPGANPMHGRDTHGLIASLNSVSKIDYKDSQDGISNTLSLVPKSLGVTKDDQVNNLSATLDGYFARNAQHLNVNVLDRDLLERAMEYPEEYPQLTIRVSGYAVNFVRLTREQQQEVLTRSFHDSM